MGPKMQSQRLGGIGGCFQAKGPLCILIGNDKQSVVDARLLPGESAKTKDPMKEMLRASPTRPHCHSLVA